MYRKALAMEQERIAQETFIGKVTSLPVVNSAWAQACGIYQKTKERNTLLNATCRVAENGVGLIATTTKPIVDRYQPQIELVNSFACQKLALVEESYPFITKPTDEVLKESKEICEVLLKPITDRYNSYRESYTGMVNRSKERVEGTVQMVVGFGQKSMDNPYGKFVLDKMDEALTLSEAYVEKYLPEEEVENIKEEEQGVPEKETSKSPATEEANTFTRVTALSSKLRQRMYKRAMRDLRGLRVRSQERLEKLNFTIDLIQYAKTGLDGVKDMAEEKYELVHTKVVDTWGQITIQYAKTGLDGVKDMAEEKYELVHTKVVDTWGQITVETGEGIEELPETFEGRTIAVARRLTCQVRQSVKVITGYLPEGYQPDAVRERLVHARQFSEDLYGSFKEAHKFEDVPMWALSQAKEKMSYLQQTVAFLTDTLLVTPITWLVPIKKEAESVEMEDVKPTVTSIKSEMELVEKEDVKPIVTSVKKEEPMVTSIKKEEPVKKDVKPAVDSKK